MAIAKYHGGSPPSGAPEMDYVLERHRRNEMDGDVVESCHQQEEECLGVLEHIG